MKSPLSNLSLDRESTWLHTNTAAPTGQRKPPASSPTMTPVQGTADRTFRGFEPGTVDSTSTESPIEKEFRKLEDSWRRETMHHSIVERKIVHPAYLRIIGMGPAVVPLLLTALRDRPSFWFAALEATANANPAESARSVSEARNAWLKWGEKRGLLS